MRKRVLVVGALLVVGLMSAATVMAGRGRFHSPERFAAKIMDHIDDALEDDAPLTDAQEKAVQDLITRTQAELQTQRSGHFAQMDKALTLFTQDKVDEKAVAELKAQHESKARAASDIVGDAVVELHDILTPKQRQVLADSVREHGKHFRD